MWRFLCLAIVPFSLLAQWVPVSFLKVEEIPGALVLLVRNQYVAPATCYILGYEVDGRVQVTLRWDVLLNASAETLEPGATRQFFARQEGGAWKPLAAVYADGATSGSAQLIRTILDDREAVAIQLARGIEILTMPLDPRTTVEAWLQEARLSQNQRTQLPLMARTAVPRYVKTQLSQGKTQVELLDSLRFWQRRLATYKLEMAFL